MTVRVNKSEFNFREKVTELSSPMGQKGSELMRSETVYQARNALSADRKNLVINGNMAIDQRNDGSSFTATDHYVLDRYKFKENTSGSFSINQDAFPVGDQHPEGHRYAIQIACTGADTSLSGNEHGVIFQHIEGFNTIGTGFGTKAAKNMTLSFWVKTNVPGTYSIALQNGAQNRCQVKEYQAGMSGTVWEKISVTFSGCNDGSWVVSTASGMKITWGLAGAQSTYATTDIDAWKSSNVFLSADQVNFFSSTNNRFFLTGVQLEIGDQATEFEHRSYGEELALCQRYFQKKKIGYGRVAHFRTSGILVLALDLPVAMRGSSSNTITQDTGLNQWAFRDGVSPTISAIQTNNSSYDGSTVSLLYTVSSGGSADETCFYYGGGSLLIDAEL